MKVVLTGGPHSGKTSLIEELARRGFATVPEAAIGVIGELIEELGPEEAQRWRRSQVAAFQERIARRQVELEERPAMGAVVFCDRGLIDGLVYFELAGAAPTPAVLAAVARARYDAIVLCDLVLPFTLRTDTGRTSDLGRARDIEARLERTYAARGHALVRLPHLAPVAARADRLLEELGLA